MVGLILAVVGRMACAECGRAGNVEKATVLYDVMLTHLQ